MRRPRPLACPPGKRELSKECVARVKNAYCKHISKTRFRVSFYETSAGYALRKGCMDEPHGALYLTGCLTRRAGPRRGDGVCPSAPLGDHLLGPQGARCRHPSE